MDQNVKFWNINNKETYEKQKLLFENIIISKTINSIK